MIGFEGGFFRLIKFFERQMRTRLIVKDKRGTGQQSLGGSQVGQGLLGVRFNLEIVNGAIEIDLAEIRIAVEGLGIQWENIRVGVLELTGTRQSQIGRTKVRIDAQSLVIGF